MYWTLELASKLEDAPWPATKDELIDYAMRSGAPLEVIENLQEKAKSMRVSKIFGRIILVKKISFLTRKSIDLEKETEHIKIPDNFHTVIGYFLFSCNIKRPASAR